MIQNIVNSKTFRIIYGVVFPVIAVTLLLGVASLNTSNRTIILQSLSIDFVVRILLSIWFSVLYIRLSRFSTYTVYPNKHWTKEDVGKIEKYYLIGLSILFCIGCGILTCWIISWFFPSIGKFTLMIALLNSFIVLLPMVTQYWVLKL